MNSVMPNLNFCICKWGGIVRAKTNKHTRQTDTGLNTSQASVRLVFITATCRDVATSASPLAGEAASTSIAVSGGSIISPG